MTASDRFDEWNFKWGSELTRIKWNAIDLTLLQMTWLMVDYAWHKTKFKQTIVTFTMDNMTLDLYLNFTWLQLDYNPIGWFRWNCNAKFFVAYFYAKNT